MLSFLQQDVVNTATLLAYITCRQRVRPAYSHRPHSYYLCGLCPALLSLRSASGLFCLASTHLQSASGFVGLAPRGRSTVFDWRRLLPATMVSVSASSRWLASKPCNAPNGTRSKSNGLFPRRKSFSNAIVCFRICGKDTILPPPLSSPPRIFLNFSSKVVGIPLPIITDAIWYSHHFVVVQLKVEYPTLSHLFLVPLTFLECLKLGFRSVFRSRHCHYVSLRYSVNK